MPQIDVGVRVRPVGDGTKKIDRGLQNLSKTANKTGQAIRSAIGFLGAGLLVRSSVRTLAEFGQEMSTVGAVTNATEKQLEDLTATARQFGATTRFSASDAAQGLTFLARAGFTAEESMAALGDTLALAQAGGLGLGRAADIASNVIQGMRLQVSDLNEVVDVLAFTANNANTNVDQLGQALSFAAPVAAGLGVSVQEASAAIAALSDAGLQGSRAGTGLTRVMAQLEQGGPALAAALDTAGLTLDDVRISSVGLEQALKNDADASIDTGTAFEIFGQRGGPAFEVLTQAVRQGTVSKFVGQLATAEGTALRVAKAMDDNLNGALLKVRSAMQEFTLAIGEDSGGTELFIAIALGLASTFNFLAENIEVVSIAMIALAASAIPTAITAITALTAKSVILQGVLAGGIFSPFVLGAAAATLAANSFLGELLKLEEQSNKAAAAASGNKFALTEFGKVGEDLLRTQKNLARLNEEIDRDIATRGFANPAAVQTAERYRQKIEELESQQEAFREGVAKTTEEANAYLQSLKALEKGVADTVAALEDENDILLKNADARERQRDLIAEVARLEEQTGVGVTEEQRAELEAAIARNHEFQRQADLMDMIQGPQLEFNANVASLNSLLQQGRIDGEEMATAIANLSQTFDGVDLSGVEIEGFDIEGVRERIAARTEELRLEQERERVLREVQGPLQSYLDKQAILRTLAEEGAISQDEFNTAFAQTEETIKRLNPEYALQRDLLEEIVGPQREFEESQAALQVLLAEGVITLDQYNAKLDEMREKLGESQAAAKGLGDQLSEGLQAGLQKGLEGITDVSGAAESLLVNAFSNAEDALVSFITTGEADFEAFVDSLLEDIARLLVRQALLAALGGGTGTGGLLGAFGGSREGGGPVEAGRPVVVGEGGKREVFVPEQDGTILSAAQAATVANGSMQQEAPQVNVAGPTIVNVTSQEDVITALGSAQGTDMIINTITQNPSAIRNALQ